MKIAPMIIMLLSSIVALFAIINFASTGDGTMLTAAGVWNILSFLYSTKIEK